MVSLGREFPMKPERADIRRILITDAMRQESVVCNGYKVLTGCAVGPTKGEGVFTDRSLAFKPNVLEDKRITHKNPPFRNDNRRNSDLGSLLE